MFRILLCTLLFSGSALRVQREEKNRVKTQVASLAEKPTEKKDAQEKQLGEKRVGAKNASLAQKDARVEEKSELESHNQQSNKWNRPMCAQGSNSQGSTPNPENGCACFLAGGTASFWACSHEPMMLIQKGLQAAKEAFECIWNNPTRVRAFVTCYQAASPINLHAFVNPFNIPAIDQFVGGIFDFYAAGITSIDGVQGLDASIEYHDNTDTLCQGHVGWRVQIEGNLGTDGTHLLAGGTLQIGGCYTWKWYNCVEERHNSNNQVVYQPNSVCFLAYTKWMKCLCSSSDVRCHKYENAYCTGSGDQISSAWDYMTSRKGTESYNCERVYVGSQEAGSGTSWYNNAVGPSSYYGGGGGNYYVHKNWGAMCGR